MRGVFLDCSSMAGEDLDYGPLEAALDTWDYHELSSPEQVAARIANADVVVANKVMLDGDLLAAAANLKLVCIAATGTNNVDLDAASAAGVTVSNVRGYGVASVSQHVFSLILALSNRLLEYHGAVRAGRWQQSSQFCFLDYPIRELTGRKLGIIGYGSLGRAVARLGEAFGMEVLLAQRPGGPPVAGRLPLDELLAAADVLSIHCPLNPATQGLIGASELRQMKSDAILINAARGGIVDEAALAVALRAGIIAGAGVDVLSTEPPGGGNPLLEGDIPNLIVTPHIAWGSQGARQRIINGMAENIRAFRDGKPLNVVAVPA